MQIQKTSLNNFVQTCVYLYKRDRFLPPHYSAYITRAKLVLYTFYVWSLLLLYTVYVRAEKVAANQ
ncbi:hypothetical protein PPYR_03679 [Photinus pyralis]|uniref:Uncharacterized protein n=1 Tax=Photinus pyralis TaxID=7054 RepID=A0A5N4A3N7_PHOPY|nr:hypothetical protein PPYR_03679 [Photinus pyralis]